jgi:hypothetical protein
MTRYAVPTTEASVRRRDESRLRELTRRVTRLTDLLGDGQVIGGGSFDGSAYALATDLDSTDAAVAAVGARATSLEGRATALETRATNLETRATALEARNPTDLGQLRRVQRTLQNLTGSTNTALTWTHDLATTTHASSPSSTVLRVLTAGLWKLSADVLLNGVAYTSVTFWMGSTDFVTARYASQGGWGAPASTFPSLNVGTEVYLAANTDIIAGIWANASSAATAPAYDAIHLSATLIRRS